MKRLLFPFALLLSVGLPYSCTQGAKEITPDPGFAAYISAYTGGVVSPSSPIRIELASPQPSVQINSEIQEQLFSFKPSMKGKAYWVNNQCIEFFPDKGQWQQGKLYQAQFSLGKIVKTDARSHSFPFSFRVEKKSFALALEPCFITDLTPGSATVKGVLKFNHPVTAEEAAKMVSANFSKIEPVVAATSDPNVVTVVFGDIPRTGSEQIFKVKVNGKAGGIDKSTEEEVRIPQTGRFYPLSVRALYQPENGVEVVFSEPVDAQQNLRGLITLSGVGSSYVHQVDGNRVKLFFERRYGESIGVAINRGVKSATDLVIEEDESYSIAFASLPPKVELPFPGNILPDSKKLIFPFKTVNLTAVDIRIIRVYESNMLAFMQANTLGSRSQLRRFGRLVQKTTIPLNQETDIKQDTWYDFSIDLSSLMKQEPGAIYHIDFTFQQAYSLYPGANATGRQESELDGASGRQGMVPIRGFNLSEKEEAYWDEAEPYYYGFNDINWDLYDWDEEDDPTKPSYYMSSDRRVWCNVMASNIGLVVKGGAQNRLWVTVSDIITAQPVKDADITIYNYQLQPVGKAVSDAQGFAQINPEGKPFVMTAKYQGQTTYLRLADGEEKSLSRFDVGGKEVQRGLKGYIYGERGVWRPGDTLFLGFIVEDKLRNLPASHPVVFELYNPNGQFYHKESAVSGENGFYTFIISTAADDPTGLWNAYVKVGGSTFHKSLRIETIKPNRLKINLTIPNDRIDASQKEVQAKLSSSWLTGAVAHELKAQVEMRLTSSSAPFPGYERYVFHNPATDFSSDQFDLFDGTLDKNGEARVVFKAPRANYAPGMLRANLISRVYEPGGDASISTQSVPFSPYDTYVGINLNQKSGTWIETDTDHIFDVVTLSSRGTLKSAGDLEYKIYRLNWSWWWEESSESFSSYVNNVSRTPVMSGRVAMKNGKGAIPFRIDYPSWGRYLVYVKDAAGGHATGDVVYVDWPSWRGRAQASDPNGVTMLSFTTDKSAYEVGETVTVMIPSATGGRALVAMENGSSVLARNWVEISSGGDTKYTFKVTEEMAPNFYLHVSLLQPHAQTANDLPIRMYGVIPVLVENKNAHLFPKIEMPEVLRPQESFTVKVSEQSGRPMTYTLAIVDDGLLDLTNFKTPDPRSEFYAREALGVRTWDVYDRIIGAFGEKYGALFSIGGDESLSASGQKANRFKPVVKFIGPFTLKKGEKKSHKMTLPAYVGSVRVMVVAGVPGAYGNADKTVPVRNPLMLLSTLPRVLSVGEDILLPVNVFAMEEGVTDVQVSVEVSDKVQISGKSTQTLRFAGTGDQLCYFNLRAGTETGAVKVKVTATGGGHTASESIEIEVRNPNPIVVTAQEKVMEANSEELLPYHLTQASAENRVTLEISRIPSVDLSRRYDWLERYEHCCTEQLTSKGFPWLFLEQFREVDKELAKTVKANVTEAIKQLYGRQLPSGGFIYWPGYSDANEWITCYAGNFLLVAKEKGYEVHEGVLKRWKEYQQRCARNWKPDKYDLIQAYRLYTLALAGVDERGAMNRMREIKELSPQAKWRLAAAYSVIGQQKAASELIWNVAPLVEGSEVHRYTYGSSLRDQAMILETMVLMNDLSSAFTLAREVSEKLSNNHWFDTQSTAFSLMAMGALADKAGKGEIKVEWSLNGEKQKQIVSAKPVYQIDLPASALKSSGTVAVTNKGGGTLYVRLIAKDRPLLDNTPEVSSHLKLEVSYTDLNGRSMDPSRLQQGTDLMAVVKVSNIGGVNYSDLALTHIIPAGWEVFNGRMWQPDAEGTNGAFDYQDIRDDRVFTYFDLPFNRSKTFKIRLQATYAGSYILPAISCEAMYDTQARAKTTAGRVEVVR